MSEYRTSVAVALAVAASMMASEAVAFNTGDVVNVGIQAGGRLVGAAVDAGIDKIKDALRDPEAEAAQRREEERRLAEQMRNQMAAIEAQRDLTPLQREEGILALKNAYHASQQLKQFVEMAEARQREQRDQIFTGAGLFEVVSEAALNSPSRIVARADEMSRSSAYRAQVSAHSESVFRKAEAQIAAGIPQAKTRAVLAQMDAMPQSAGEAVIPAVATVVVAAVAGVGQGAANANGNPAPAIGAGGDVAPPPVAVKAAGGVISAENAFVPDLGKKLYVEFAGSPTQTQRVRALLSARGHTLVDQRDAAEVAYLFDGAYTIPGNRLHEGVRLSVGNLIENPGQPIPEPEKKLMGSLQLGLGKLLLSTARAQGADIPQEGLPREPQGYPQQVLLMVARQPKDGAETRLSVVWKTESESIMGTVLSKNANAELMGRLGIFEDEAPSGTPG